jgi:hypothetical protein
VRELLRRFPAARDIEITGADLEDAFVELTGGNGAAPPSAVQAQNTADSRAAASGGGRHDAAD